jgi:hypothetical protein
MTKRKEPEQEEASTESFSNDGKSEEGPVLEVDVPGEATYWLPFHILRKHPASLLAYLVNEKVSRPDQPLIALLAIVSVGGRRWRGSCLGAFCYMPRVLQLYAFRDGGGQGSGVFQRRCPVVKCTCLTSQGQTMCRKGECP